MRDEAGGPRPKRVQLVLHEGTEPLPDEDVGQVRVPRLLEAEHEQLAHRLRVQRRGIEVALLHPRRVHQYDPVDAQRSRRRKDPPQRLRPGKRQQRIAGPEPCPYLEGISSTTETMLMTGVSPAELDDLLVRGWRRFGPVYFRPVCATCDECVSVRVPVATFSPSPNLRRVLRRGSHLRLEVGEPLVDDERLELYRRWHTSREARRGWKPDRIGVESYAMQFCFPHAAAREFSYWDGEELMGIGIADETPHALSAVYCYYDPDRSHLSIGTYNVLRAIEYE